MSYSRPVEKLNKNNDIAKKKEGRIWSRPGRPITFIPRGGLVNITGDARRHPRPVARYIYIYIVADIVPRPRCFPRPLQYPCPPLVTGIYLERTVSILISGHRPDGRGRSGLCDEFTSTLRRILGISAPLIKGLRYTNISNTLPGSCYSFFSFFFLPLNPTF